MLITVKISFGIFCPHPTPTYDKVTQSRLGMYRVCAVVNYVTGGPDVVCDLHM